MKLKFFLIGLAALLLMPAVTLAANFQANDNINFKGGQTVKDDVYLAGNTVNSDATIANDLFAAGSQITISGKVDGSAYIAGSNGTISAEIGRNLYIAGGTINIRSLVGKDLFIAGGTVTIEKEAKINGDIFIAGGTVTIAGTTNSIKASVDQLTLTDTAKVNGDVTYWSSNQIQKDGATVTGTITQKEVPNAKYSGRTTAGTTTAASILFTLIIALLLVWVFPNTSDTVVNYWKEHIGFNILWGLLFLIVAPIVAILLLVTIIGIPFGIGLFLIYPIYLYLGKIVGIIGVGSWIKTVYKRSDALKATWASVIFGVIAYEIIAPIPVIGWVGQAVIFLAGVGALIDLSFKFLQQKNR